MANENVIQATFDGFFKTCTEPAWFIDHGMELSISGIDLPAEFECHFSNSRSVAAKRQIGANGVVAIPDEYFLSNAAQIFCWIYLHPTVDSGVTEYEIVIPLRPRPNVDPAEPTQEQQDIVDQAIAALNAAVEQTGQDVADANEAKEAAQAAQQAIEDMTVSSTTLSAGSDATVTKTEHDGVVNLAFGIPQGDKGDTGDAAGFGTVSATVDANTGTPSVEVTTSGPDTAKNIGFAFHNLKGDKGDTGATGADGITPTVEVTAITGGHNVAFSYGTGDARNTDFDVMDGITPTVDAALSDSSANPVQNKVVTTEKADIIVSSASGSVASFVDGAALPVKDLAVGIDPVQDLHGYSSPWPAGGGKNKFDVSKMVNTSDITINNGVISVTDNAKNSTKKLGELADLTVGETYILTANTTGAENIIYLYGTGANVSWTFGTSKTITQEMANAIVFFYGGTGTTSQITNMMIRPASENDATFAPYSNICPITGWTGANVTRTGKNILPYQIKKDAPNITFDPLRTVWLKKNNNYTISCSNVTDATSWRFGIILYDAAGGRLFTGNDLTGSLLVPNTYGSYYVEGTNRTTKSLTFTLLVDCYVTIIVCIGDTQDTSVCTNGKLEIGSTATAYEPYQGTTYPVTWQTEAGTVYGGTVDVVTGVLTVDRAMYVPTGNEPNYSQQTGRVAFALPNDFGIPGTTERICSDFRILTASTYCYVYTTLTPSELKEYFQTNTVQMVLGLATPLTYQLTPTEISTLLGTNNIWADAGDTTVTYRADTKLYIDNKITQAIAAALNA